MSALTHIEHFQFGTHASVMSLANPASYYHLTPRAPPVVKLLKETIDRANVHLPNGTRAPNKAGIQKLSISDMDFELRGLSGGGAGDNVNVNTTTTELEHLLKMIWGRRNIDINTVLGTETDGSPGSSNTPGVTTSTAGSDVTAYLLKMTSGDYVAREKVSTSGGNPVLNYGPINRDGTAGAWEANETVYAADSYHVDPEAANRIPVGADMEGELERYIAQGITAKGHLTFPEGGIAGLMVTDIMATLFERSTSLQDPTYAARTRGNPICVNEGVLMLDGVPYQWFGATVDPGSDPQPRKHTGAENNMHGRYYGRPAPTIKVSLPLGSLTGPNQITESLLNDMRNLTEYDVCLQVGNAPGETCLNRMPRATAELADVVDDGGAKIAQIMFSGLDPSAVSNALGVYPLRTHFL